jgi:hypothetical protein
MELLRQLGYLLKRILAEICLKTSCRFARYSTRCLARFFLSQLLRRQLPQFVVDQRQKLSGRLRIAGVDGVQELSEFRNRNLVAYRSIGLGPAFRADFKPANSASTSVLGNYFTECAQALHAAELNQ